MYTNSLSLCFSITIYYKTIMIKKKTHVVKSQFVFTSTIFCFVSNEKLSYARDKCYDWQKRVQRYQIDFFSPEFSKLLSLSLNIEKT